MNDTFLLSFFGILLVLFAQCQAQADDDNFLNSELDELKGYLQFRDSLNLEVSKVDVAWHLDHSAKAIIQLCNSLANSDPENYKANFNFKRMAVFATGSMPRGVGIASPSVTPPEMIRSEDILAQLESAKQKLLELESYDHKSNFQHPVFGQLNRKQTKRFIKIHTDHHLKIIKDILEKK